MTNKGRRFGQAAFPRSYWKKGNFPLGIVFELLKALGAEIGAPCVIPLNLLWLAGSFDEKSLWNGRGSPRDRGTVERSGGAWEGLNHHLQKCARELDLLWLTGECGIV